MKNLIISISLALSVSFSAFCQDTSVYNLQRNKINALLTERSQRFGQYDQSLNERTGIFGWQTKKDIKRSNEILREIALNDNEIFKQLKVLLDYKDLEVQEVKTTASNNTENLLNYRTTIKNLQQKNYQLSSELDRQENLNPLRYVIISLLLLGVVFLTYLLIKKTRLVKQQRSQLRELQTNEKNIIQNLG